MATATAIQPPPTLINNCTSKPSPELDQLCARMIRRIHSDKMLCGFSDQEVYSVLTEVRQLYMHTGCMVQMHPPLVVFGDVHGQINDLLRLFSIVGTPPQTKMLFLGDYIDRCKMSFEVIMLLFCYKVRFPHLVELLRGNHECAKMNRLYGFYEEVKRKRSIKMWKVFQTVFNEMPLCAKVGDRILCMHGGISPDIKGWDTLKALKKPKTVKECDEGIPLDLMWSDPTMDKCGGFQYNKVRSASYIFGNDCIIDFCQKLDLDMIVRAHEVVKDGHLWYCDNKLCTIFSAPNYCGSDGNAGSVMKISDRYEVSFETLNPKLDTSTLSKEKLELLAKQTAADAAKSPNPMCNDTRGKELTTTPPASTPAPQVSRAAPAETSSPAPASPAPANPAPKPVAIAKADSAADAAAAKKEEKKEEKKPEPKKEEPKK